MEKVQEKYIRWLLGRGENAMRYMVKKEGKRDKLRMRMGRRAVRFEEKLEAGGRTEWARRCWEIKGRKDIVWSEWEEQRKDFYKEHKNIKIR